MMKKSELSNLLEILNYDKVIDCNQYQGEDFEQLLKRVNIVNCLRKRSIFGIPNWVKKYKNIAKKYGWY